MAYWNPTPIKILLTYRLPEWRQMRLADVKAWLAGKAQTTARPAEIAPDPAFI